MDVLLHYLFKDKAVTCTLDRNGVDQHICWEENKRELLHVREVIVLLNVV